MSDDFLGMLVGSATPPKGAQPEITAFETPVEFLA